MKLGIIGTGVVGKTIAARLAGLGHEVMVGTRDPEQTLSRTEPGAYGTPPFGSWQEEHPEVKLGTFEEAAAHGEMVVSATAGGVSLEALELAGEDNLSGKILMDVANPLDFSRGMPPTLAVSNTDSLGEQIQRRFPAAKVVKTLNTMNAYLMVDPAQLPERPTAPCSLAATTRRQSKRYQSCSEASVEPNCQLRRHHDCSVCCRRD